MVFRRTFRSSRRRSFTGRFRRRYGMKRRRFGARKTVAYTGATGSGRSLGFRSRRVRPRAFRRILWRDTLSQPHYRSYNFQSSTISTGTTSGSGDFNIIPILTDSSGNPFWSTANGAVAIDNTVAVPNFRGDIILRGGKIGAYISLPSTVVAADNILVKVWHVKTLHNPNTSVFSGAQPLSFDPSAIPDMTTETCRILQYREAVLSTQNPTLNVEYRLRLQKIDQDDFATGFGQQDMICVYVSNISAANNIGVQIHAFHNVSFSGDAIGAS